MLAGATVTISVGATAGDLLQLTSALDGHWHQSRWLLDCHDTGADGACNLGDYRAVLRSVTFSSSNNDPTASFGNAHAELDHSQRVLEPHSLTPPPGTTAAPVRTTSVGRRARSLSRRSTMRRSLAFDDGTRRSDGCPCLRAGRQPAVRLARPIPMFLAAITVTDPDDTQLAGATVVDHFRPARPTIRCQWQHPLGGIASAMSIRSAAIALLSLIPPAPAR